MVFELLFKVAMYVGLLFLKKGSEYVVIISKSFMLFQTEDFL